MKKSLILFCFVIGFYCSVCAQSMEIITKIAAVSTNVIRLADGKNLNISPGMKGLVYSDNRIIGLLDVASVSANSSVAKIQTKTNEPNVGNKVILSVGAEKDWEKEQALIKTSTQKQQLLNEARTLENTGDYKEALSVYKKFLELSPNDQTIINKISILEATGTVTDIDGNVYKTIKIGDQWWMAENLKVTHYRNGDAIDYVTDNTQWTNLTIGAFCYYNNDKGNATEYGALYNWFAVNDSRNIAPEGWHVPTDEEWTSLTNYLGGESVAGGKIKETGTAHWKSPNTGATNVSSFSARAGGIRRSNGGHFNNMGYATHYWSATGYNNHHAWFRRPLYNNDDIHRNHRSIENGYSIRLVRDN